MPQCRHRGCQQAIEGGHATKASQSRSNRLAQVARTFSCHCKMPARRLTVMDIQFGMVPVTSTTIVGTVSRCGALPILPVSGCQHCSLIPACCVWLLLILVSWSGILYRSAFGIRKQNRHLCWVAPLPKIAVAFIWAVADGRYQPLLGSAFSPPRSKRPQDDCHVWKALLWVALLARYLLRSLGLVCDIKNLMTMGIISKLSVTYVDTLVGFLISIFNSGFPFLERGRGFGLVERWLDMARHERTERAS